MKELILVAHAVALLWTENWATRQRLRFSFSLTGPQNTKDMASQREKCKRNAVNKFL
jgi:hypothetical protein